MARTVIWLVPLVGLVACGVDALHGIPPGDSAPAAGDADVVAGDPDGGDAAVSGDADLPEACKFYGIDADSSLWMIDTTLPAATWVGATGTTSLTDIAIQHDGRVIVHTLTGFYQLSPASGGATAVAVADPLALEAFHPVASDALDSNRVLVGGLRNLGIFYLDSGTLELLGDFLPVGWEFAGDIATVDEFRAYVTAKSTPGAPDHLFFIDRRGVVLDKGSLSYEGVWGLDFGCDGQLYGLVTTAPMRVIRVDPDTMVVTEVGTIAGPTSLWGAAGPSGQ